MAAPYDIDTHKIPLNKENEQISELEVDPGEEFDITFRCVLESRFTRRIGQPDDQEPPVYTTLRKRTYNLSTDRIQTIVAVP